jgi:hypothetical protein
MVNVSKETRYAIATVWGSFGSDGYEAASNNAEAIELVLDANRLSFNGYPEAEAEIKKFLVNMNFGDLVSELSKMIRIY